MKLIALTLPDNPAAMPGWIDQQLVSTDLGQLVAELRTIHGSTAGGPELETILGEYSGRVMQNGLAALPRDRLTTLLRHPRLLLDLQDKVLMDGGHYWRSLPAGVDAGGLAANGLKKVQTTWSIPTPASQSRAWFAHPAIVSLATAAAVILAVFLFGDTFKKKPGDGQLAQSDGVGWGWAKAGAIPDDGTAKDYLNRLADGANEWTKKRPTDAAALAKRINEFRSGCTTLIFAKHVPLNDADKKWLNERCRIWGERLDKQLQAIESGQPVTDVQGAVDEIATQMVQSLRTRADSVS